MTRSGGERNDYSKVNGKEEDSTFTIIKSALNTNNLVAWLCVASVI